MGLWVCMYVVMILQDSASGSVVYEASKRTTRAASPPPIAYVASPIHATTHLATPAHNNNNNITSIANNNINTSNAATSSPSSRSKGSNTVTVASGSGSVAGASSIRSRTSAFTFVTGPPAPLLSPNTPVHVHATGLPSTSPSIHGGSALSSNNNNTNNNNGHQQHHHNQQTQHQQAGIAPISASSSSLLFQPPPGHVSHHHQESHSHSMTMVPVGSPNGSSSSHVILSASPLGAPSSLAPLTIGTTLSSDFTQSSFVQSLGAFPATSSVSMSSISPNHQQLQHSSVGSLSLSTSAPVLGRAQSWTMLSATSPHGLVGSSAPSQLSAVIARHHPSASYLIPPTYGAAQSSAQASVAPASLSPSHTTSLASSTASHGSHLMYTQSISPIPITVANSPGSTTSTLNSGSYNGLQMTSGQHLSSINTLGSPGGIMIPSSPAAATVNLMMGGTPTHNHAIGSRSSSPHQPVRLNSPPPFSQQHEAATQSRGGDAYRRGHSRGNSKDYDSPNGSGGGRRPLLMSTLPGGNTTITSSMSADRGMDAHRNGVSTVSGSISISATGTGSGTGSGMSGISSDSPVPQMGPFGVPASSSSSSSSSSKRKLKVLVVDDVSSNRRLLAKLLERRHVDCVQAENGRLALDLVLDTITGNGVITTCGFDAVLLDQEMPVMDGPTCARALRDAGLKMTILGLTGHTDTQEVWQSAGANAVLTKPANIDNVSIILIRSLALLVWKFILLSCFDRL
jgi:CheY-like chemotaxis protein